MGSQVALIQRGWIGRFNDGSSGELANGDMIGMPIGAIWPKRHHYIGFHTAHISHNLRDRLRGGSLVQVAINIIQEIDLADAKYPGGCQQLRLAYLAQCFQPWIITLVAKPATLSSRRCNEVRLDSLGGIFREDAAITQRFI